MKQFVDLLIEAGADVKVVLDGAAKFGQTPDLLDHLRTRKLLSDYELHRIWGESIGAPYLPLRWTTIDRPAMARIPRDFAERHLVMPLHLVAEELTVAMANPNDLHLIDRIRSMTRCRSLLTVYSTRAQILEAITLHYEARQPIEEIVASMDLERFHPKLLERPDALRKLLGSEPMVRLSEVLVVRALQERASDVHLEQLEDGFVVRFRIDGLLKDVYEMPAEIGAPLISRFKIMASLDVADRQRPQDGRFHFLCGERRIDMRIATLPTLYGEKAVLRLLDRHAQFLNLTQMNFAQAILDPLERMLQTSQGILFVTGPTGSGKTTSLYGMINHLNDETRNLITLEDPIEYRLARVNQVQIRRKQGLDFASALRSVLRQDPDVIMVGEIRDNETAQVATHAALTGHLVLASLHTNNAVQAINRLADMGVSAHLLAPAVIGVLSQRLVRRICEHCRVPDEPSHRHWLALGLTSGPYPDTWRGAGCDKCQGSGYFGRIALHELLVLDDRLRQVIVDGTDYERLNATAVERGFRPMAVDGLKKVLRGLTTVEEVARHSAITV